MSRAVQILTLATLVNLYVNQSQAIPSYHFPEARSSGMQEPYATNIDTTLKDNMFNQIHQELQLLGAKVEESKYISKSKHTVIFISPESKKIQDILWKNTIDIQGIGMTECYVSNNKPEGHIRYMRTWYETVESGASDMLELALAHKERFDQILGDTKTSLPHLNKSIQLFHNSIDVANKVDNAILEQEIKLYLYSYSKHNFNGREIRFINMDPEERYTYFWKQELDRLKKKIEPLQKQFEKHEKKKIRTDKGREIDTISKFWIDRASEIVNSIDEKIETPDYDPGNRVESWLENIQKNQSEGVYLILTDQRPTDTQTGVSFINIRPTPKLPLPLAPKLRTEH